MDKFDAIKDNLADIKDDVSQIKEDVSEIKTTMAVNTASLEYHVARTNELQDIVVQFKAEVVEIKKEMAKQETKINTAIKVIAGVAAFVVFLKEIGLLDRLL